MALEGSVRDCNGKRNGMSTLNEIRWGVLGLGWFGEIHVETLSAIPGVAVGAVCTRTASRLNEIADRFGVENRYSDFREMIDDPSIDIIDVTTHVNDHAEMVIAALEAGKHVFVEKPMAMNVAECDRMIAAAEKAPGLFMVGHICRFDPRIALAKQAVEEGRLGKIISMHARRNLSKTIGEANLDKISALFGDGIHDVDVMLWLCGAAPTSIYAQQVHPGKNKFPDVGWAMARLDSGATAVVESVWHLPRSTPYAIDAKTEIIGTEGALYVDCGTAGLEIHDADGVRKAETYYWPVVLGKRFGILKTELEYFTECVRTGTPPTHITPAESRAAVAFIEAAVRSAETNQVIRLP